MPPFFRYSLVLWTGILLIGIQPTIKAVGPGFLEGHLRILSLKEVDITGTSQTPEATAENYASLPLIILSRDWRHEIARVNADAKGNYRLELPPGEYILDVKGQTPKRLRATPQAFTVTSGQTVHVNLVVDTGVR